MIVFADFSALMKLYADEPDHKLVREQASLVVSALARVEVPAAIWRKHRMGELDPADAAVLVAAFEADYHGCAEGQPRFGVVAATATVLEAAARLVGVHSLRLRCGAAGQRESRHRGGAGLPHGGGFR